MQTIKLENTKNINRRDEHGRLWNVINLRNAAQYGVINVRKTDPIVFEVREEDTFEGSSYKYATQTCMFVRWKKYQEPPFKRGQFLEND
jgi:hypothetical protein